MGPTADQLRQEIEHKREDAAAKIDAIEERIETATAQVRSGVEEIPQALKGEVQEVTDKVKENLDLRRQIEQRPLAAIGAGLLGGFLLGGMGGGSGSGSSRGAASAGLMGMIQRSAKESGLEDTLTTAAQTLMGSLSDRVKGLVESGGGASGLISQFTGAVSGGDQGSQDSQGSQGSQGSQASSSSPGTESMGAAPSSGSTQAIETSPAGVDVAPSGSGILYYAGEDDRPSSSR